MKVFLNRRRILGFFLGPALFLVVYVFFHPEGLNPAARAMLAGTLWVAAWWITEPIPIAITSLFPLLLFPLSGSLGVKEVANAYGHPLIFLFMGGFIIALAMERWNLHKRIAMGIISGVGTNPRNLVLGFMVATAFLSMWISNTATAMMMMPIGLAIIPQLDKGPKDNSDLGKALMLGIAYGASIGGIATLIGTPPNIVLFGMVKEFFDIDISFADWMLLALPLAIVLLMICWIYLVRIAFPLSRESSSAAREEIRHQKMALGKMGYEEKWVLAVFLLTAIAWITRSVVIRHFFPNLRLDDTMIAIGGAFLLFLIPSKKQKHSALMDWETAVKLPWGILLLFGGGLAIAAGFTSTGLAAWIGDHMHQLDGIPIFIMILVIAGFVNFFTEITSNVATASMLLPVLAALAIGMEIHPYGLMIAASIASSCAFMLPVAAPPNAVVFGSDYIKMKDMIDTGVWMNMISIILITLFCYYLLPVIWGLDLHTLPEIFTN